MPLDWEQEWYAPTRQELEREQHEEWLIATYEERFHEFCEAHLLDPDSITSVLMFEGWFNDREE